MWFGYQRGPGGALSPVLLAEDPFKTKAGKEYSVIKDTLKEVPKDLEGKTIKEVELHFAWIEQEKKRSVDTVSFPTDNQDWTC